MEGFLSSSGLLTVYGHGDWLGSVALRHFRVLGVSMALAESNSDTYLLLVTIPNHDGIESYS